MRQENAGVEEERPMPKVPLFVYKAQLDALERKSLGSLLFGGDNAEDEIEELLELLGRSWPRQGSMYPKGFLQQLGENKTVTQLLRDNLCELGRISYRLSHRGKARTRGIWNLEVGWEEQHQVSFARLALDFLGGFCLPPHEKDEGLAYRDLPLRILLVDNRPNEIPAYNELLPPELGLAFWRNATWYVRQEDFAGWRDSALASIGDPMTGLKVKKWCWDKKEGKEEERKPADFDLIIQDHFLGSNIGQKQGKEEETKEEIDGVELSRLYLEAMPQALVFLTTGLDIESVTALGDARGVDRVVPKSNLAALPWYYHLAFLDVLGSMFWESWLHAGDEGAPFLERRTTLRALLGSIRRWQHEPEILWHGQALPEMVDHGDQHIRDLWRLTNEILGARKGNLEPALDLPVLGTAERILLALGIWLHDVGHRGDEFAVSPATIRDVHGSISEHLLLQCPAAFGLEWLMDEPGLGGTPNELGSFTSRGLWEQRNDLDGKIPAIRLAGLLCRHHQSSAPLVRDDVGKLHFNLKFVSDYARVAWRLEQDASVVPVETVLDSWRDRHEDLNWIATDVRTLEDFAKHVAENDPDDGVDLMKCGCLLRFLDALHLQRCRAGSPTRRATHQLHLDNRKRFVEKRLRELEEVLRRSPAGSTAHLEALQERFSLEHYYHLLHVQDVHLWRQAIVERLEARFEPKAVNGDKPGIVVTYTIRPSRVELDETIVEILRGGKGLEDDEEWKDVFPSATTALSELKEKASPGGDGTNDRERLQWEQAYFWVTNLLDDVLKSEIKGQVFSGSALRGLTRTGALPTVGGTYLAEMFVSQADCDILVRVDVVGVEKELEEAATYNSWTLARLSMKWERL